MGEVRGPVISRMRGSLATAVCVLAAAILTAAPPAAAQMPAGERVLPMQSLAGERMVPVPRVTIYPGDTITESMLAERTVFGREFDGPSYAQTHVELIGKVARQTLLPNQPIAATGVREPHAIVQGRPAVVIFQSGGLIISATAMPLQAGAVGEVISLRNTDSGTTIRGVVQADGTVRVGMP